MKMKVAFVVLSLIVLLGWGIAQEIKPVAVSPGSERGVARVSERCPTFSWSAIGWAAGYRIAVFEAKTAEVGTYERMALSAAPVMTQNIPGKALSWTPSEEASLSDGGQYVWYVQARDASGNGLWSAGKIFRVELDGSAVVGPAERETKKLRTRGVSGDASSEAAGEDRTAGRAGAISRGFSLKRISPTTAGIQMGSGGPGAIRTQGSEGDANWNVYYGTGAGDSLGSGAYSNSFFGYNAGIYTTSGDNNIFIGYAAGYHNTTGNANAVIGAWAGFSNTTAGNNTFLGHGAGMSNTTGYSNTFLGYCAGNSNTTAGNNTFLGSSAGYYNSTGINNTFLGFDAGHYNTTGGSNTFLGHNAGSGNSTGSYNTMVGYQAGSSNTASSNTFLGYNSGYGNTTGTYNTFFGQNAGRFNTTGSNNVFLGLNSSYYNTSGGNNVVIGVNAGFNSTAGQGNVIIGYRAGLNETGSNKLYISNSDTASPLIWGDFSAAIVNVNGKLGVGVKSPVYPLQMASGAKCTAAGVWLDASSRSLKENIQTLSAEDAQATLADLAPVRFNYKADREDEYLGFIAEDVPALVAVPDRTGLSPMDIVAVLTKVVQEQQKTNDELRKRIDQLQAEIETLKEHIK